MCVLFTEDPVKRYCTMACGTNSVLKLFIDLFSGDTTAQLFYTNDTKVLVDIVARQLADLSPGEEVINITFYSDYV
jgi:hypothetical protein